MLAVCVDIATYMYINNVQRLQMNICTCVHECVSSLYTCHEFVSVLTSDTTCVSVIDVATLYVP